MISRSRLLRSYCQLAHSSFHKRSCYALSSDFWQRRHRNKLTLRASHGVQPAALFSTEKLKKRLLRRKSPHQQAWPLKSSFASIRLLRGDEALLDRYLEKAHPQFRALKRIYVGLMAHPVSEIRVKHFIETWSDAMNKFLRAQVRRLSVNLYPVVHALLFMQTNVRDRLSETPKIEMIFDKEFSDLSYNFQHLMLLSLAPRLRPILYAQMKWGGAVDSEHVLKEKHSDYFKYMVRLIELQLETIGKNDIVQLLGRIEQEPDNDKLHEKLKNTVEIKFAHLSSIIQFLGTSPFPFEQLPASLLQTLDERVELFLRHDLLQLVGKSSLLRCLSFPGVNFYDLSPVLQRLFLTAAPGSPAFQKIYAVLEDADNNYEEVHEEEEVEEDYGDLEDDEEFDDDSEYDSDFNDDPIRKRSSRKRPLPATDPDAKQTASTFFFYSALKRLAESRLRLNSLSLQQYDAFLSLFVREVSKLLEQSPVDEGELLFFFDQFHRLGGFQYSTRHILPTSVVVQQPDNLDLRSSLVPGSQEELQLAAIHRGLLLHFFQVFPFLPAPPPDSRAEHWLRVALPAMPASELRSFLSILDEVLQLARQQPEIPGLLRADEVGDIQCHRSTLLGALHDELLRHHRAADTARTDSENVSEDQDRDVVGVATRINVPAYLSIAQMMDQTWADIPKDIQVAVVQSLPHYRNMKNPGLVANLIEDLFSGPPIAPDEIEHLAPTVTDLMAAALATLRENDDRLGPQQLTAMVKAYSNMLVLPNRLRRRRLPGKLLIQEVSRVLAEHQAMLRVWDSDTRSLDAVLVSQVVWGLQALLAQLLTLKTSIESSRDSSATEIQDDVAEACKAAWESLRLVSWVISRRGKTGQQRLLIRPSEASLEELGSSMLTKAGDVEKRAAQLVELLHAASANSQSFHALLRAQRRLLLAAVTRFPQEPTFLNALLLFLRWAVGPHEGQDSDSRAAELPFEVKESALAALDFLLYNGAPPAPTQLSPWRQDRLRHMKLRAEYGNGLVLLRLVLQLRNMGCELSTEQLDRVKRYLAGTTEQLEQLPRKEWDRNMVAFAKLLRDMGMGDPKPRPSSGSRDRNRGKDRVT